MIRIAKLHEIHLIISKVRILRFIYNRYRELKLYIRDYSLFAQQGDTCFIYMADGKMLHGGLADRLYGIMNAFAFCKARNISFRIYFVYPFNIREFLIPNKYDWTIEKDQVSYSLVHSKVWVRIQENGWQKKMKSNKQIHLYCNTKNLNDINRYFNKKFTYNELFNELFIPSNLLQKKLNTVINHVLKKPYIGIHFRFKNSLGDFKEITYQELPNTEKQNLLDMCYHVVASMTQSDGNKAFITSDSKLFLENISKRIDAVYFIPGETTIMDSEAPLPIHEKTFLDFFILGSASKIISIYGHGLFLSGFSAFSSEILNAKFEEINIETVI